MAEIAGTVELLSDAWYEAFGRLLKEAVQRRSRDLMGVNYTLCEVITDCPDGGVAAHWFSVKHGDAEFHRGLKADTDARLTIAYELAGPIARTPMAVLDAGRDAAPLEPNRMKYEGPAVRAVSPVLAEALRETHDRLAELIA
jgi:hypothetical protein